ncbi:MAG: hypothetical protein K9M94_12970, partial [Spirochaetia bacterium]|nr:hypothetical protein [Spirochaetia bacterium]
PLNQGWLHTGPGHRIIQEVRKMENYEYHKKRAKEVLDAEVKDDYVRMFMGVPIEAFEREYLIKMITFLNRYNSAKYERIKTEE